MRYKHDGARASVTSGREEDFLCPLSELLNIFEGLVSLLLCPIDLFLPKKLLVRNRVRSLMEAGSVHTILPSVKD